ncbi:unnamed protein product, partial [Mesorhabditis spiculigera]
MSNNMQHNLPTAQFDLSRLPEVFDELARLDTKLAESYTTMTRMILSYEFRLHNLRQRLAAEGVTVEEGQFSDIFKGAAEICSHEGENELIRRLADAVISKMRGEEPIEDQKENILSAKNH